MTDSDPDDQIRRAPNHAHIDPSKYRLGVFRQHSQMATRKKSGREPRPLNVENNLLR